MRCGFFFFMGEVGVRVVFCMYDWASLHFSQGTCYLGPPFLFFLKTKRVTLVHIFVLCGSPRFVQQNTFEYECRVLVGPG